MHLADAFIQSRLYIQVMHIFVSTCVPWESNPQPLAANAMLYHWATGTQDLNPEPKIKLSGFLFPCLLMISQIPRYREIHTYKSVSVPQYSISFIFWGFSQNIFSILITFFSVIFYCYQIYKWIWMDEKDSSIFQYTQEVFPVPTTG